MTLCSSFTFSSKNFISFDAAINELNIGAGSHGLDLNSGWNCEATKYGWSLSSIISTKSSSGDNPLNTNP